MLLIHKIKKIKNEYECRVLCPLKKMNAGIVGNFMTFRHTHKIASKRDIHTTCRHHEVYLQKMWER